ncbi:MAG TPA: response regulator [Candidatus Omnitrophica bacterium]|nr:response regulator [Candidatus Omnitrophota bacterium]
MFFMKEKSLISKNIAEYCQVTQRTAVQWINEGKLKSFRTPGKHIRVNRADFIEFLKKYQMPIPEELVSSLNTNSKKKILIVDDDRSMVDSIRRFLQRETVYDLEIAYDGFEAGQKFSDFKPDLVILDIKMPGLDGYKLCSHIRDNPENKNTKILLISGVINQNGLQQIKKSGANDYLAKPFNNKALKIKIEELLGGGD